jgi:Subtilisin inhibitor-like
MRVLALTIAGLIALGSAEASVSAHTELRISFWPRGKDVGGLESWTLRCQPLGGTLRQRAQACRRLSALRAPFAPVAPGLACSHIYSGPELALVSGSFRGRRVWTYFKRTDSCQTERWNRVAFLFPRR